MAGIQNSTKHCSKCDHDHPIDHFCRDKSRPDGLSPWCKACRVANTLRWDALNPSKRLERGRRWKSSNKDRVNSDRNLARAENPEEFRRKERERYWKNPGIYRAKRIRFGKAHPEYRRRNSAKYYQRHKAKFIALYVRTYRARKRNAPGRYTPEDIARIEKAQRARCGFCRVPLKGRYHIDHIIPLSKRGTNWPSNLQLLCESCNCSKSDDDPIDFARRKGRLLESHKGRLRAPFCLE